LGEGLVDMKSISRLLVSVLILAVVFTSTAVPFIPVTGSYALGNASQKAVTDATIASQINLAAGAFAYDVIQQPKGNAGFVSTEADTLTQFSLATKYGSQGYLAHNYLAGASFFNLLVGSHITVTYADGHQMAFEIKEIRHLQAVHPNSPTTSFLDLDNHNVKLTAKQVFMQTYGVKDHLILQTCIANGNELSWGRLFIVATPAEEPDNIE
jgi:hypothetical protein